MPRGIKPLPWKVWTLQGQTQQMYITQTANGMERRGAGVMEFSTSSEVAPNQARGNSWCTRKKADKLACKLVMSLSKLIVHEKKYWKGTMKYSVFDHLHYVPMQCCAKLELRMKPNKNVS